MSVLARTRDRLGRERATWLAGAAATLAIAIAVPVLSRPADLHFWTETAVLALYAMSVNLLLGYAGIPSFGQAAYFGIGAYAVGLLATRGFPLPLTVLAGTIAAAVAATIVVSLSVRASGLAFSMLTLAFAQALFTVTFRLDLVGGENGLVGLFPGTVLGLDLTRDPVALWLFVLALAALVLAGLRLLVVSPFGTMLQMMRDDERRAEFLGVPVVRFRTAAFAIAGGIAGFAGALDAYVLGLVTPDHLFWTRSGEPIVMAIIGGMHHFLGPVVGTVVYLWTRDALSRLTVAWVLWIGLAFLVVVIAAPRGLLGLPATLRAWKRGR